MKEKRKLKTFCSRRLTLKEWQKQVLKIEKEMIKEETLEHQEQERTKKRVKTWVDVINDPSLHTLRSEFQVL